MVFTPFGGGLLDTLAVGASNSVATGLTNQLTSNINFSIGSVLANGVRDASGYSLAAGNNWALSQISAAIPPSLNNGLNNAIATQVATVGLNAVNSFASQTIENLLGGQPIFSNLFGNAVAPAREGFIGLHTDGLPDAEYGDQRFTLTEIIFSVVPANIGPQTQPQPQSAWKIPLNTAFKPDFEGKIPALNNLKGGLALAGPGSGLNIGKAGDASVSYKAGKIDTSAFTNNASLKSSIPAVW